MKSNTHIQSRYSKLYRLAAPVILLLFALGLILTTQVRRAHPTRTPTVTLAEQSEPLAPPIDLDQSRQQAYSVLRNSLEHEEPLVREAVLEFVRQANEPDWQEPLLDRLDVEDDPRVRAKVAITLGELGTHEARARVRDLRNATDRQTQPELRMWYEHALALLGDRAAPGRLYRAADSQDLAVSLNASLILARMAKQGDHKAIRQLQELIPREDELVAHDRFAGVTILANLARLGHDPAREQLRTHLHNPDDGIRLSSAQALADIGDDAGRETLFDIFNHDDQQLRLRAAAALVSLGDYDGIDTLLQCALDPHSRDRTLCISSLSTVGVLDHVRALSQLYEDDDRLVSVAAATSVLFIIGLQPQVLSRKSIDWVKSALESSDWTARRDAITVTASLPPEWSVPLLAQAVLDEHAEVRHRATEALGKARTDDAARIIAAASQTERNAAVKQAQIKALARIGSPVVAETLLAQSQSQDRLGVLATGAYIAVLDAGANSAQIMEACARLSTSYQHGRTVVRLAVIESALLADNPIVVPILEKGLTDGVFDIRLAAAEGMAHYQIDSDRAVDILRSANDRSMDLSLRATAALLKLGERVEPENIDESLLEQPEPEIRLIAIGVIVELDWVVARPLLSAALTDDEPAIRQQAIEALDTFVDDHPDETIHMLKSKLRDPDLVTRMKAQAHLAPLLRNASDSALVALGEHTDYLEPPDIADNLVMRLFEQQAESQRRIRQLRRQLEESEAQRKSVMAERATVDDNLKRARAQIQRLLDTLKRHGLDKPDAD